MRAADIMLQKFGAPVLIDCIYEPELNPNDGGWVCMYVGIKIASMCAYLGVVVVVGRGDDGRTHTHALFCDLSRSNHLPSFPFAAAPLREILGRLYDMGAYF